MMTTFAAMAAAAPLALGIGAGAELRQPLGIAVLGGLMVSQVLTLFITPVVYLWIEGLNARFRSRRGAAEVREMPAGGRRRGGWRRNSARLSGNKGSSAAFRRAVRPAAPRVTRTRKFPDMKTPFLIAAASGALLLSATATAQVQSQPQQTDVLGQILGAMFGNNQQASEQALESDWNQGQRPFAQRRARLDARIDTAVRDGTMSRGEADQIRREYDDIVRLESQYSADGNVSRSSAATCAHAIVR